MLKKLLMTAALVTGFSFPAHAVLQIAISDGTNTFTCADGGLCDDSLEPNKVMTLANNVGNFSIEGTLSTSTSPSPNSLDLSTFTITNNGPTTGTLTLVVSDTDFLGGISRINESGSLTFHDNTGVGDSTLSFFADHANGQGAGAGLATPGVLLFTASGHAVQNPDSFAGTNTSLFSDPDLFSMTERATLLLKAGGSVTGFDVSMSAVPETSTWLMMIAGFMCVGGMAYRRGRNGKGSLRLA
jgi:hypothetical protein